MFIDKAPAAGHGSDIWSRVTTVASQLTVNVSQAVQKTIQVADGEGGVHTIALFEYTFICCAETPPGEESRLTKAMKAYHLAKARSPADLPAWLFEENERGVSAKTWRSSEPDQYEDQSQSERRTASRNKSGLRDIYDSVPRANNTNTNTNTPTSTANAGGSGSKATDRLRAIRDAKRTANQNISEDAGERGSLRSDRRGGGLPSRPARQK